MMRVVLVLTFLLAAADQAVAGAKGNLYGFVKAETPVQEGCPIELKRVGVQDSESMPTWNKALVGAPEGDGSLHAATVRYDVAFRTRQGSIEAVELEWLALNAFDELLGRRQMSFSYEKPLSPDRTKRESEAGPRIAEGTTKYRVRVSRVRFSDGTIWADTTEVPEP